MRICIMQKNSENNMEEITTPPSQVSNPTPPVSTTPQPVPAASPPPTKTPTSPKSKKKLWIVLIIIVLFLIIVGGASAFFIIQESSQTPTPTPTPVLQTPTPTSDPTADWQTYTNTEFGFSFKYPQNMKTSCTFDSDDCSFDSFVGPGRGPENFIWLTIIPVDSSERKHYYNSGESTIDSFLNAKPNEKVVDNPVPEAADFFTYTRLDDISLDNVPVKVFENNNPWESKEGTISRRIIFTKNNYIYTIGAYIESEDISLELFNQILSTFKFTN